MLAANSKIVQDVPPFILAGKYPVKYTGINSLGLKRRNFSNKQRMTIKKAYRYYFRSDLNTSVSLKKIKDEFKKDKNIKEMVSFIENSQRGII
jgi:UDP-N-acetylglucosamine acyltransferase